MPHALSRPAQSQPRAIAAHALSVGTLSTAVQSYSFPPSPPNRHPPTSPRHIAAPAQEICYVTALPHYAIAANKKAPEQISEAMR